MCGKNAITHALLDVSTQNSFHTYYDVNLGTVNPLP
jgi:hypothetical protein